MSSALARMITIGILGPAGITLQIAASTVKPHEGAIAMCVFLLLYGSWAFVVCQRIEFIVIREVYDSIERSGR